MVFILCLRPPIECVVGIMFSGRLYIVVVRPSVCSGIVLLARYLTNQWTEFHQTLVDDCDPSSHSGDMGSRS